MNVASLSIPTPNDTQLCALLTNFFYYLSIFNILTSLISFTSLYNLPILAILTMLFTFPPFELKLNPVKKRSNGMIAMQSIGNHYLMQMMAIIFLSSIILNCSSQKAVLKIIIISNRNRASMMYITTIQGYVSFSMNEIL